MTVMAGTCSRCASGNHSSHMVSLGGICIGCACTVKVRGEDPPVEKRVDTLRRAAALMRERAEKAEASWPSPWFYSERHSEVHHSGANGAYDRPYVSGADGWHADEHQASWHPRVALAAAEMLEEFARLDDQGIHPPTSVVTLAKRYLGEA